jgi:hypothetical protein
MIVAQLVKKLPRLLWNPSLHEPATGHKREQN